MASRSSQHAAAALACQGSRKYALSTPQQRPHVHRFVHVELTLQRARAAHRTPAEGDEDGKQRVQSRKLLAYGAGTRSVHGLLLFPLPRAIICSHMDMLGPACAAGCLRCPSPWRLLLRLGQRQWQHSDGTCRADGAGARDGLWAHVRTRIRSECDARCASCVRRSGRLRRVALDERLVERASNLGPCKL